MEDLISDKISENAFDKGIEKELEIKDKHAEGTANKLNDDDKFNKLSDNIYFCIEICNNVMRINIQFAQCTLFGPKLFISVTVTISLNSTEFSHFRIIHLT